MMLLGTLGSYQAGYAQEAEVELPPWARALSPAELQEDWDSLQQWILHTPVDPFAYQSHSQWDSLVAGIDSQLTDSLDNVAFFQLVNPVLSQMGDVHTRIWVPRGFSHYVWNDGFFLPMVVEELSGKMYVMQSRGGVIPPGSLLLEVNGVSGDSIREMLHRHAYTDGRIHSTRNVLLEESFYAQLPMVLDIDTLNEVKVQLPQMDEDSLIEVKGERLNIPTAKIARKKRKEAKVPYDHICHLDYVSGDSVAMMTIGSFSEGSLGKYRRFLKKSFKELAETGTTHLIIDLRDNRGGYLERGPMLYQYMTDSSFKYIDASIVRASRLFKNRIQYILKFPDLAISLFGGQIGKEYISGWKTPTGQYDTLYHDWVEPIKPKRQFSGKVYLLANGGSISNSSLFAHCFVANGRGPLIGEPVGGTVNGTFGNSIYFQLPNSRITGQLSTIRVNLRTGDFNYEPLSLDPDHIVEDKLDDLISGKDTQLQYILEQLIGISALPDSTMEN
ncbi:S41 family peptidase [Pontibacter sp. G13]|uniref:S41 family peptidase n=1 Tax=Pontibacter sp. G13 TaxID=3074898 RepID=UPI00288A5BFC|nr:S41 family peptidase [Pontibacter sp. G13]WNJ16780.1 S41 family peptidase [Pontibacter sp. G13]